MSLHPVIQKMIEAGRAAGRPPFAACSPVQARAMVASSRAAYGSGPDVQTVESLHLPSRAGALPARLYRPQANERGLLVYLHGGGWVCGGLDDFDALARTLAHLSGCAVLLVDYRLAPEHPFPAGLEDAEDALAWAAEQGMAHLGRPVPLMVAGDSAGANLGIAAVLALRGRVPVALQCWFYPVTDCDLTRPSYRDFSEGLPLSRDDMRWFFQHYAAPAHWPDERISVLRTPDLSGAPPAWIATAEYDVLRDEGEAYAQRLLDASVPVDQVRFAGLPHGFARMFNLVDTAQLAVQQAAAAIAAHGLTDTTASLPSNPDPEGDR